jgi:hypothetical protein
MDASQGSGWAAAGVAAASAVGSLIGWWRSRAAKKEAAEQARLATEAQVGVADALKRIADAGTAQQEAEAQRLAAEEIEPWVVDPIPGNANASYLRNKTGTPKYGIAIANAASFVIEPNSFHFIGPYDQKQFTVMKGSNRDLSAKVTWHQREDRADPLPPQTIVIP